MVESLSRMTEKGQVTIPASIRKSLGLKAGDYVRFEVSGDRIVLDRRTSRLDEFFGFVRPKTQPEDWASVREQVETAIAIEVAGET